MTITDKRPIDALIVGAGFAGLVAAEQLSKKLGWKCVVVDQRDHIGGNAYDYYDDAGVLVHKYGPHYFRTNSEKIVAYLSQFTEWRPVDYKVHSYTEGRYWSFPINLKTFEQLIGRESTSEEFEQWMEEHREKIENPQNSEEVITSQVGYELYEKFFKGYTIKQWKKHPRELDKSVCGRIPIRTNRDDRYLRESFQALPANGYTALFDNIVKSSLGVEVKLSTSLELAKEVYQWTHLVYTGPIDAYFDNCLGKLPYRSLRFEHESFDLVGLNARRDISGKLGYWQPEMQVNYPSIDVDFTRIVEIKHATGQEIDTTTIVKEFPADYEATGEPYYPVPNEESKKLYEQYKQLAEKELNTSFIGRLGTYKYYNMDQVVGMALKECEKIEEQYG
ncbi:MAG: UDP-galactopyranose mutase [Akkermansiaceae bacterium]